MCGAAEANSCRETAFPAQQPSRSFDEEKKRTKVDFFKMSFFNDLSVRQKVERGEK